MQTFAQEFSASADKTTVQQGERFQVSFTFTGGDVNSVRDFRQPTFAGFAVLSGPNQSSSIQIINGQLSATLTYSYILKAISPGKYVIGKASLFYRGKRYETEPLKINVVKYNTQARTGQARTQDDQIRENVFIRAIPSKSNVYKDEQIIVTYKLYTRLNISSPQISKLPSYQGFWSKDLDMPDNIGFHYEMYKGKRYRVAEIKKVALFPRKTGKLKIDPFALTVPVVIQRRRSHGDIFDDFFNDPFFTQRQTVEKEIASNTVTINVKPLPQPVPKDFSGAVGRFDFNVSIDKLSAKVNEPITLKLTLKGTGNIELAELPKPEVPQGFEVYDPKITENIRAKNFISGTKTAEYLIVPRVSGKRKIKAIKFVYFDLDKKQYVTKSFGPFNLDIARGKEAYAGQTNTGGFSKEDIQLLSKDIRYIKTNDFNLRKRTKGALVPDWFYGAIFGSLFLFFVAVAVEQRKRKLASDVERVKMRKTEKEARKRLKEAKKSLDEKKLAEFYDKLSFGLSAFLETKLKLPKAEFTLERAVSELKKRGVDEALIAQVRETYEKSEFARFAPSSLDENSAKDLYEKTIDLIVKLNDQISKGKK
jgi:hypothetical protein